MKISKKTIEHLANLAKIKLDQEEKEKLLNDLNELLEYIDKLKKVNTENVLPFFHSSLIENVTREDKEKVFVKDVSILIESFKQREGSFLKVKKII